MTTSVKNRPSKLKVVLDTNVWISGIVFAGQPGRILDLFGEDQFHVVVSEELLTELRRKMTAKFPLYLSDLNLFIEAIRLRAFVVKLGSHTINISRDPDDNKVIETAVLGACDYIVSGDKDLLVLKKYQEIEILNPTEFLTKFDQEN